MPVGDCESGEQRGESDGALAVGGTDSGCPGGGYWAGAAVSSPVSSPVSSLVSSTGSSVGELMVILDEAVWSQSGSKC